MSLDTRYRPRTFDDVLGQEATITILRRFIATGRALHQSYLFAGLFGSGKTTLGRILARALMCEAPTDKGDPCDACPSCRSILETGTSMDFVEVDAATNSGKADVQKIVEDIQYSTFAGRRRIYLFDEAHQLSRDALDALLKPLEECIPGTQEKRLVCIFCTTEPEKMRATIFSRCAPTFVVQPVAPTDIAKRLGYVCDQEGYTYDPEVLPVIAEMTECHIRDALKALEGVSLLGPLNRENVSKYLKLDLNLAFIGVLEAIGKDLPRAITLAKEALVRTSPATCYEKLANMAMLAYQVGIGAIKPPIYVEGGRLEALYEAQKESLLGFGSRFASRAGRPTDAMLLCDIGSLHYGGGTLGTAPVVVVQRAPANSESVKTTPVQLGNISVPTPLPTPAKAGTGGRKKADVRTDPRAVGGNQPLIRVPSNGTSTASGSLAEIDPATFGYLLAMQIAHYEAEGGPTGRSDMGRHRT